jgi:transaldolase
MNSRLSQVAAAEQSIWLDYIHRGMFASGKLRGLIELGLRGMTSNPTIFEKAISSGNDYDDQLATLVGKEQDPRQIFEALAVKDIRSACDEFRPLYEATSGSDGFVSIEVSPTLAYDTAGSIAAAQHLFQLVDRPNVMVKIPGTAEGVPAIAAAIELGININVTLLFSVEQYEASAHAYLTGMERRLSRGEPVQKIASVASVFVSRIDSVVDAQLKTRIEQGAQVEPLLGKAGIANSKLIYERYKQIFSGGRWSALQAQGVRVQRPLWGSTSTKNPAYHDLMYVENLIGRHTVNTVPVKTLDALLNHGRIVADTIESDLAGARATLEELAQARISLFEVGHKLQLDGVAAFADSYKALLAAIALKQKQLKAQA